MAGSDRPGRPGVAARRVALEVLARVEDDGAYANLALRIALDRSTLEAVDRNLVTDLVAGTVRRRRAVDALADRFLTSPPPPAARRALRLGVYQLAFRPDLPAYAVVSTTVDAGPARFRGLVNAVLRKVASAPVEFASMAEELSYPDWIVDRLVADLGEERAQGALAAMDEPPPVHRRPDGYTQDLASQWVAAAVGALPGERVADLCAAPGGKATALAATGAVVVANELTWSRVGLLVDAARTVGGGRTLVVSSDARALPLRPGSFDRVLLDAPCSGLGVLGRRSDARWRLDPGAPDRLAELQSELVVGAADLLVEGGTLVYSVCTVTTAETLGVDEVMAARRPDLIPLPPPGAPWEPHGRGALLLPQVAGTDGMSMFRYRRAG